MVLKRYMDLNRPHRPLIDLNRPHMNLNRLYIYWPEEGSYGLLWVWSGLIWALNKVRETAGNGRKRREIAERCGKQRETAGNGGKRREAAGSGGKRRLLAWGGPSFFHSFDFILLISVISFLPQLAGPLSACLLKIANRDHLFFRLILGFITQRLPLCQLSNIMTYVHLVAKIDRI